MRLASLSQSNILNELLAPSSLNTTNLQRIEPKNSNPVNSLFLKKYEDVSSLENIIAQTVDLGLCNELCRKEIQHTCIIIGECT
ncbi:hypothetical protein QE152_g22062 [Popillia japonica]|uniref:Uncharacterized protein n=1 Tax=Popillia japonica TaxID=7064 RepID=A0AAW1KMD9_POPJA